MELLNIIKRAELFHGLSDKQLERVAGISAREAYRRGDVICNQGDKGDKMYIISSGQVEIVVRSRKGSTTPVLYLGEGQVVGEMALIDEGTRSATVVAADDDTVVYSIPSADFTRLCQEDTGIGYVMMRNLAMDLSFKLRHRDFDPSST